MALALVDLREKSRLGPDVPAESADLMANGLQVLRHQGPRPLDTVRAVYLALAPLSGHLRLSPAGKPSGSDAGPCACS